MSGGAGSPPSASSPFRQKPRPSAAVSTFSGGGASFSRARLTENKSSIGGPDGSVGPEHVVPEGAAHPELALHLVVVVVHMVRPQPLEPNPGHRAVMHVVVRHVVGDVA